MNTILCGQPYQTLSARSWERKKENKLNMVMFIDWLVFFEDDHCMHCWVRWKIGRYAMLSYGNEESDNELRPRQGNLDGL